MGNLFNCLSTQLVRRILPGFRPLNTGISKCSSYLRLIVIWLLLYCFEWLVKWTKIAALDVLIALFIEHDYHKTKDLFLLSSQPDFFSSLDNLENPRSIDCYVNWESQCHMTQLSRIAKYNTGRKKVKEINTFTDTFIRSSFYQN